MPSPSPPAALQSGVLECLASAAPPRAWQQQPDQPLLLRGLPTDGFAAIVADLLAHRVRYGVTAAKDTTAAAGSLTVAEALGSVDRYLQWGLSAARDPRVHPPDAQNIVVHRRQNQPPF